ncbi:amino acid permease-domain-containing protein [Lophiotrema nucula]|uniref:Amino acid permease-domain-containing protein n=1 Tax=Lophiotrema nucula TaxID=690887 RepID=A0A6A5ZMY7_9PLEO|nr:amino acid permease-domain-containing protein [Lophiotrema nucula]
MEEPTVYRRDLDKLDATAHDEDLNEARDESDEQIENEHTFRIPEDRKLGIFSTSMIIVNRMIGTGIFSTPSSILQATNSTGAALLFWFLGGIMSLFGLFAYLELGTTLPRSGGEKVYLERIYRWPKYLATCIFAVEFVCFSLSTANTVNFSSHLIRAAKGQPEKLKTNCGLKSTPGLAKPSGIDSEWVNKGISITALSLVCLCHAFTPKWGIWLSNILGVFKMIVLALIIFTGLAALAGRMHAPRPDNFSSFDGAGSACELPPFAKSTQAANYALALLQVLYSYSGWESANYVLTEVRDAPRTLRIAAPMAVSMVMLSYILANIAYFAASTKSQIANSGVTVAAGFFEHVWGPSTFVTRVLPVVISLSSLGNVFAQTFANGRVKQEFAKEGVLPFSRLWASDWPVKAPSGGIFLHWLFSFVLIIGPKTSDVYPFVTTLSTYTQSWIKFLVGVGLLYMTFNAQSGWRNERTSLHAWPPTTAFWLISLLFVLLAPFMKNTTLTPTIPWYVIPTIGCSMLVVGTLYWMMWSKVLPALLGYKIEPTKELLADGSERINASVRRIASGRSTGSRAEYHLLRRRSNSGSRSMVSSLDEESS